MNGINAKDCTLGICYKEANVKSRVLFLAISIVALAALIYVQIFYLNDSILDYKIIVYTTMGLPVASIFSCIFCKPDIPINQQSKDKDMAYGNGINRHNDRNEMYYRNYQNNLRTIERSQAGLNNMLQSKCVSRDEWNDERHHGLIQIFNYGERQEYMRAHWYELYKNHFVSDDLLSQRFSSERKTELIAKREIVCNKRIAFVEKKWERYAIQCGYTDIDVNTTDGRIKMARAKMRLWQRKEIMEIESGDPDIRDITCTCECNYISKEKKGPKIHKNFSERVQCIQQVFMNSFERYRPSECSLL